MKKNWFGGCGFLRKSLNGNESAHMVLTFLLGITVINITIQLLGTFHCFATAEQQQQKICYVDDFNGVCMQILPHDRISKLPENIHNVK